MIHLYAAPLYVLLILAAFACLAVYVVWLGVRRVLFARELRRVREIPNPSYSGFQKKPGRVVTRNSGKVPKQGGGK